MCAADLTVGAESGVRFTRDFSGPGNLLNYLAERASWQQNLVKEEQQKQSACQ
jgi:hypothetical protein